MNLFKNITFARGYCCYICYWLHPVVTESSYEARGYLIEK